MKNLSIKFFFVYVCVCVSAVCIFADCPTKEGDIKIFIQAQERAKEGKIDESMKLRNKAVEKFPNCFVGYMERGILLRKLGKYQEAIADFEKALKLMDTETNPDWKSKISSLRYDFYKDDVSSAYANLGTLAKEKQDFNGCTGNFTSALKYYKDLLFYKHRATCYEALNQADNAAEDVKSAAEILRRQKKFDEALEFVDGFIKQEPNNAVGFNVRCQINGETGKFQSAANDCEKAFLLNKNSKEFSYDFAFYAEKSFQFDKAVIAIKNVVAIEAAAKNRKVDAKSLYEMLAKLQYQNNDFTGAATILGNAANASELYKETLSILKQKTSAIAKENFKIIPQTNLTDEIIKADAQLLAEAGKKADGSDGAEAVTDLTKIINRRPHYAKAVAFRGYAYYRISNYEKAIADLELAVKLQPWQGFFQLYLANAYANKDPEKCIETATNGIKIGNEFNAELYNARIICGLKSGKNLIQVHSDYLHIKWVSKGNFADISDEAIDRYAEKQGCGKITSGDANDYYQRAGGEYNADKDPICVISDTNRALQFAGVKKGPIYALRGFGYYRLASRELPIAARFDLFEFYLRAANDLRAAIDNGDLPPEMKFDVYQIRASSLSNLAEKFSPTSVSKADAYEAAARDFETALTFAAEEQKDRIRLSIFENHCNAMLYLAQAEYRENYVENVDEAKKLNARGIALNEKINSLRTEFSKIPSIAAEIERFYQEFSTQLQKARRQ